MNAPRNGTFDFSKPVVENEGGFYLFFDTETTGLPRDYKAPISQLDNWPRIVQIAWMLYNKDGNKLSEESRIVRPEGFEIPIEASNIHGITTEKAIAVGLPLVEVLKEFKEILEKSKCLVAHNMSYDIKIIQAEFLRNNLTSDIDSKKTICTKETSTNFCAIDGPYGYKWPRLSELYTKLFAAELKDSHDALVDVRATALCFWEMKKRGIL